MIIVNFLEYLQYEKRFSQQTIISYKNDLLQFCAFLFPKKEYYHEIDNEMFFKKLTHVNIRNWIVFLKKRNYSSRSINRKISSLKSLIKYCLKKEEIVNNPLENISSLKTDKRLFEYVREEQINKLEEQEAFFSDDFSGVRDNFIIELLYNTGIRRAELINLKHKDFDLFSKTIKVLGKRNKERIIPINDYLSKLYSKYCEKKKEKNFYNSIWLIVTDKGIKLYPKFVYLKVIHYLSMITDIDKKSPHILRHSFATHMLNNGADINAIKELLGHTTLSSTQIYTHNTLKKIKEIYKQAHPRS